MKIKLISKLKSTLCLGTVFCLVHSSTALGVINDTVINKNRADEKQQSEGASENKGVASGIAFVAEKYKSSQAKAEAIFAVLSEIRKDPKNPKLDKEIEAAALAKIQKSIDEGKPIQMYIPSFPVKAKNTKEKVIPENRTPDLAEKIALDRLAAILGTMNKIHPTTLSIIMDGRIFAGSWWTGDKEVNGYRDGVSALNHSKNIHVRDLNSFFPHLKTDEEVRKAVLEARDPKTGKLKYAPTHEEVEHSINDNPDRLTLYKSFKIFWEQDTAPDEIIKWKVKVEKTDPATKQRFFEEKELEQPFEKFTVSQRRAIISARVYEMIIRNDAMNNFLREQMKPEDEFLRLSIRPQGQDPNKISINLLQGHDGADAPTPWHACIIVNRDGSYQAVKRKEAEARGCVLAEENGLPYFKEGDLAGAILGIPASVQKVSVPENKSKAVYSGDKGNKLPNEDHHQGKASENSTAVLAQ